MSFYRQCELKRVNTISASGGHLRQVAWIPEEYAKKGKWLKIKKDGCRDSTEGPHMSWEDGWQVVSVGARASTTQVRMYERQHLRQRGQSDI